MTTLSKRQMIYPFNMKFERMDIIETQKKLMKKAINDAAAPGSVRARTLQQQLMMDDYFQYFQ